jgi:archaellum component FlaC
MKLLMENWREKLEEAEFEMKGVEDTYEPMVSQEAPAESPDASTMELLNQLDELVTKIKESLGAAPESARTLTKMQTAGPYRSTKTGKEVKPPKDLPFEE